MAFLFEGTKRPSHCYLIFREQDLFSEVPYLHRCSAGA